MRPIPLIVAAVLMAALTPTTVSSQSTGALDISAEFLNADGTDEAGVAVYEWQSSPVLRITIEDELGQPVAATVNVFVTADDFGERQLRTAVKDHTDDGVILFVLPKDVVAVGFLPGAHRAWVQVEADSGARDSLKHPFVVSFP